jgi:hypothetical protein
MRSLNWRGWSPDSTCAEYAKLQRVAEELLQSLSGAASLEQYAEGQKSLLFLFQELKELMDPLHPRHPGGHRCLEHCYLEYAMRLRNQALLFQPAPPEPPAAPSPQPLTDEELMRYVERWSAENAQQTFFGSAADGEDQHDTGTPRT